MFADACGTVPPVVNLTEVSPGELTFRWSQLASNCQTVQYVITSDCGNCYINADTLATCSDLQLSVTERNCTFSVNGTL